MPTALIVEPSRSFRQLLAGILKDAGWNSEAVESSAQAIDRLQLANQQTFDLILTANQLTDNSGMALVRAVRAVSRLQALPVAFITTVADRELARQALMAGATEVFLREEITAISQFLRQVGSLGSETFKAGRVLLVEDSETMVLFIKSLFEQVGLACDDAASVDTAQTLFDTHTYHLIVVDMVLEGVKSGAELVRRIRRQPGERANVPILAMSGFDDQARQIELIRSGVDDFIRKPFDSDEFLWRIRNLLARHPLSYDDLQVAPVPSEADVGNPQQSFTQREREICDLLLKGFSDKRIANELNISFWTVRTYISRIFNKLGVLNRTELTIRLLSERP